ncbi:MAG TPA: LysR family transcriptional regulator [Microthrixaceae bacterium]|nr:LysR family transcriptional regulator [Microthrixaceae bacterium]
MDRKQLRAFVAVAEQRSFSAGARVLGTVQSNVSAHVARLEKQLGVLLIDRSTNELTDEGRVVLERARRIEGEFEALDADVASLRDVVSGSVRLGAIGTTARWLVAPLLDAVTAQYPEIRVIVLDATTTSLVPNLASGAVDLAIVNLPIEQTDLLVEPLFDEDRILIVPDGHPLADHDSVTLSELSRHELLLEARGTAFRDVLDQAATAEGVVLRPKAELDGMRLLASLVFAGFGAGVVPASAIPPNVEATWRRIPVEGVPGRSVGLARRRRGLPTAAQRVVAEQIRRTIAEGAASVPGVYPTLRPAT